jgi:PadR family transcriptional regulator, regulatory protein PadR
MSVRSNGPRAYTAELRKGTLEYCVLALLSRQERYGFELVRTLGSIEGLVTSEGTIYPLLTRLKKDGFVATTWRDSQSGPPRKYYAITAQGEAVLDGFRHEWRRFRAAVDALLDAEADDGTNGDGRTNGDDRTVEEGTWS